MTDLIIAGAVGQLAGNHTAVIDLRVVRGRCGPIGWQREMNVHVPHAWSARSDTVVTFPWFEDQKMIFLYMVAMIPFPDIPGTFCQIQTVELLQNPVGVQDAFFGIIEITCGQPDF